jgi:hypothetical protein
MNDHIIAHLKVADRLECVAAVSDSISSHAQVYRRLDVAESVGAHVDGPHAPGVRVPKESHKVKVV